MGNPTCQSCGIAIDGTEIPFGTNTDGAKNGEYCSFCYWNGEFTFHVPLAVMKDVVIGIFVTEFGKSVPEAKKFVDEVLPGLKRWKGK